MDRGPRSWKKGHPILSAPPSPQHELHTQMAECWKRYLEGPFKGISEFQENAAEALSCQDSNRFGETLDTLETQILPDWASELLEATFEEVVKKAHETILTPGTRKAMGEIQEKLKEVIFLNHTYA